MSMDNEGLNTVKLLVHPNLLYKSMQPQYNYQQVHLWLLTTLKFM